ncbi:MAG: hypothetical protein AB1758_35060 [Candidatus Eremiobacterota bacterium]
MSAVDLKQERERIVSYLRQARQMGDNVALVGGAGLPETTVFECILTAFPERRVVHLDATVPVEEDYSMDKVRESLQPGGILLISLYDEVGLDVLKYVEQLCRDDHALFPGGETVFKPSGWHLIVHSRLGGFPFEELMPARLALG